MTSTAEEKLWGFPPDDRAGALEKAERCFLAAASDHGCDEITAQSRVSAVMRRCAVGWKNSKQVKRLLHGLTEPH
jgi:hypothetical protein